MENETPEKRRLQEMNTTELARERNRLAEIRTEQASLRTLLANERTFLSWARASIGIITLGFVLEKAALYLKHLMPEANPKIFADIAYLSVFTLVSGMALIITSAVRYFAFEKKMGARKGILNPKIDVYILLGIALVLSISFFFGKNLTFNP
ncbi:YidH family protein [Maridesulfovibrio bastinii]|jgi:putative membrane protein|uniref:YidH family protein n=1 Tax=Maridesulfovibrio bastinii TaxID=47157 RepID=UPI0004238EED|nr:DUF202 domain-containing protein [Maridesulfovibrio bastinii]